MLRADNKVNRPGDIQTPGLMRGNGQMRHIMPFNSILFKMACNLPPDPPKKKYQKVRVYKLSDDQVRRLRGNLKHGELRDMAKEFGLSYNYASSIRMGVGYTHIPCVWDLTSPKKRA